jgi:large subunit ribosomal protein L18
MNIKKRLEKRQKKTQRCHYKLKQINAYNDRLRINVVVSEKHGLAQVLSSDNKTTLAYASTQQQWFKDTKLKSYNIQGATQLGEYLGKILSTQFKDAQFYFDRGNKVYTGRIKAIADGIRSQGIQL